MKKKLITLNLTIIMVISLLAVSTSAHNGDFTNNFDIYSGIGTFQEYDPVGNEAYGWVLSNALHNANNSVTYRFDTSVPANLKTIFRQGVQLWNNSIYTNVTITEKTKSNETNNIVSCRNLGNNGEIAFYLPVYVSDTHVTGWSITLNTYYNSYITSLSCAHELGHVFGLLDLYDNISTANLMYYSSEGTATNVTQNDANGVNLTTGQHSTHLFQYTYTETSHDRHCTICNGCKTGIEHNYNICVYSNTNIHRYKCKCGKMSTITANHNGTRHAVSNTQHLLNCSICGLVYENHSYIKKTCVLCGYINGSGNYTEGSGGETE